MIRRLLRSLRCHLSDHQHVMARENGVTVNRCLRCGHTRMLLRGAWR